MYNKMEEKGMEIGSKVFIVISDIVDSSLRDCRNVINSQYALYPGQY
jgi:hypothetical protein